MILNYPVTKSDILCAEDILGVKYWVTARQNSMKKSS